MRLGGYLKGHGGAAALILAGAVLVGAVGPAAAQQDLRPLWDRIQRMERDLSTLQQQAYGGRPPPPGAGGAMDNETAAAATVRMAQLEADLRTTTGQLEEINFAVGQMRQRLDRLVTDVDFRLGELEKVARGEKPAAAASAAPADAPAVAAVPGSPAANEVRAPSDAVPGAAAGAPPAETLGAPPRNLGSIPQSIDRTLPSNLSDPTGLPPPGAAPQIAASPGQIPPTGIVTTPAATAPVRLPAGSSKDQYDYAFDLLKRAEYAQAEQALRQFVSAYPNDPLAGNAQYWLAETYYVRNNYSEAAAQFLKGYQTYPQSPKAADNLFKLGMTLTILGKTQDACSAFQRFDREYASAPGVLKRRVSDERQRLNCG